MCRFGKHRKTLDVPLQLALRAEQEAMERVEEQGGGGEEEKEAARRAAQEEQQRIQEQYRRLMQRQRQMENQVTKSYTKNGMHIEILQKMLNEREMTCKLFHSLAGTLHYANR